MQNKNTNSLTVLLLAICVLLLVLVSFIGGMIFSFRSGPMRFMGRMMGGNGMMGSGGMMNSNSMMNNMDHMMGQEMTMGTKTINKPKLDQLVLKSEQGATIDQKNNTVTYTSGQINIVALASPSGKPDMTFEIDGLVNPTLVAPQNSNVQLTVVNTDPDELHGFEITRTNPPYSVMPMMNINNDFLLMPMPHPTTKFAATAQYYSRSGQLALQPGTYYYLCPVPGHAEKGMYGTLKIK